MRTLVYGAGPLGSTIAGRLLEAGVPVTLLARRQRLADLTTHGVLLEDAVSGRVESFEVAVTDRLDPEDRYDLIIVAMRKDQSEAILPALAANRHAHTILFMQNNAAGFDTYRDTLGQARVMAGFPLMGGQRADPVMRIHRFGLMASPVGEIDGSLTERTYDVADLLARMRGHRIAVRTDMDAWLVTHVTLILTYLGVYAAGLDAARFSRTRDARLLGVRARNEALRAQRAAGIPVAPAWFTPAFALPEPLVVAQLQAMAATDLFDVGVIAHARVAREEMRHLLTEFTDRVAPGGLAMPTVARLAAYAEDDVEPLPDGSATEPLRWGGMAAFSVGFSAFVASAAALLARAFARK